MKGVAHRGHLFAAANEPICSAFDDVSPVVRYISLTPSSVLFRHLLAFMIVGAVVFGSLPDSNVDGATTKLDAA